MVISTRLMGSHAFMLVPSCGCYFIFYFFLNGESMFMTLLTCGLMHRNAWNFSGYYVPLRVALHLKAGPLCCVRGLKSSLVIGQKVEIGPIPFTPRGWVDSMVCFFLKKNQKVHGQTWPELVKLGAPKMTGQFLASGPMSNVNTKICNKT